MNHGTDTAEHAAATTTAPTPTLLTPEQAGEYLGGVSVQTLAGWRCRGSHGLPFVRIGSRIRYRLSDLDAWMQSRTMTATPRPRRKLVRPVPPE